MNAILKCSQVVFLGVFLFSCNVDENLPTGKECTGSSNLVITSTKVCGWFPNYDSMSIDSKSLRYYNYCMDGKPAEEYPVTCDEWTVLVSKLDADAFRKLTINTCNICVDGCDISLSVRDGDQFHQIKFGPDQIPDTIKEFVSDMETLRADAKAKVCK